VVVVATETEARPSAVRGSFLIEPVTAWRDRTVATFAAIFVEKVLLTAGNWISQCEWALRFTEETDMRVKI
jgi:hypothetical protein